MLPLCQQVQLTACQHGIERVAAHLKSGNRKQSGRCEEARQVGQGNEILVTSAESYRQATFTISSDLRSQWCERLLTDRQDAALQRGHAASRITGPRGKVRKRAWRTRRNVCFASSPCWTRIIRPCGRDGPLLKSRWVCRHVHMACTSMHAASLLSTRSHDQIWPSVPGRRGRSQRASPRKRRACQGWKEKADDA